jgi:hypothetical protein
MGEDELTEIEASKNCLTPLRAIRSYCRSCMNDQLNEVKLCPTTYCPLYIFRNGRGAGAKMRLIRLKCLDCSGEIRNEVRECFAGDCSLYPFRMGKNPNVKNRVPPLKDNGQNCQEPPHRKPIFKEKPMGGIPV